MRSRVAAFFVVLAASRLLLLSIASFACVCCVQGRRSSFPRRDGVAVCHPTPARIRNPSLSPACCVSAYLAALPSASHENYPCGTAHNLLLHPQCNPRKFLGTYGGLQRPSL